jgi:hypothetical protein
MDPVVVLVGQPGPDRGVQVGQRHRRRGVARIVWRYVPRQGREQLGGDSAEEPFDLARPRGIPGVLWMSWTLRSAQTRSMWSLVKSAPWSLYRAAGSPQTGHAGSAFRQIACRNANAVCNDVGSPKNMV